MEDDALHEHDQFEELIQGLIDHQYGCCDDFFSSSTVLGLRSTIQRLSDYDKMKLSGLGSKQDYQQNEAIRGDKIHWIQDHSTDLFEQIYLQKISNFIQHLNKTCFTSIKSFESHYSQYKVGAFYKRHLDQFKNEKGRKFSIILYLNEDWKEEDGGVLSLYLNQGVQKDIAPLGGRLVFFRSDELEHEVRPSFTRERNSIAGWLKDE